MPSADWKNSLKNFWQRWRPPYPDRPDGLCEAEGGPSPGQPPDVRPQPKLPPHTSPSEADGEVLYCATEAPAAELPCPVDYWMARRLRALAWQLRLRPEDLAAALIRYSLARRAAILAVRRRVIAENRRCWQSLTPRQRQVAALICQNNAAGRPLTYQQIAGPLGISAETVKAHTSAILEKFDATSRLELRVILNGWDFETGEPGPHFHWPGMAFDSLAEGEIDLPPPAQPGN